MTSIRQPHRENKFGREVARIYRDHIPKYYMAMDSRVRYHYDIGCGGSSWKEIGSGSIVEKIEFQRMIETMKNSGKVLVEIIKKVNTYEEKTVII